MSDDMFGDTVYEAGEPDAEIFEDPDETLDTSWSPPDRQPSATKYGTTAAEEAAGETLDQRLLQEEPDITADDVSDEEPEPRAGRLVDPGYGDVRDEEKDEIAIDVGPAGYASS